MNEWDEMMAGVVFITDLGENKRCAGENGDVELGRYAVWSPIKNTKGHAIVEIGENLEGMAQKYHVPEERICVLRTTSEK